MSKPPKMKNDVTIIHIIDGQEIKCSYFSCMKKFEPSVHLITRTPKWNGYKPITSKIYCWKCKECGSEVSGRNENKKSYNSYMNAIRGQDESKLDG